MDAVFLSRFQFAMTIGFHFIFPPLTIGMSWLIFWFTNQYRKTSDEAIGQTARFWTKLFVITFAIGVATGITMEFQFGTNWADYSRFVGDIFGAPLAAEGLLAFFLESTFMGVLLFGWGRLSKKTLTVASFMVAFGSTLSAFWIIVADSWMQTPAGFEVIDGKAVLTDFFAAVFNPSTMPRYVHMVSACIITGAFFMLGVSAWYLWKNKHVEFASRSIKVALVAGFIGAAAQVPIGHWHAIQVAETQPAKLAAFEGLYETQKEAPLALFGIPNAEEERLDAAITIPYGLSLLVGLDPQTEVIGLKDFAPEDRPPAMTTFFSFHLMFILGMYFIALTGLGLLLWWRGKLFGNKLFMMLSVFSLPLPIITNELGWFAAEVGRQPWIVYPTDTFAGMRTADAVSPSVSAGEILFSIILFGVIYLLLFFVWVYLLKRQIARGPEVAVLSDTKREEAAL